MYLFDRACASLRPGDIVIDAGANIGDISERLASKGAVVYAFEPDPYAFEKLSDRFARTPNVKLFKAAIGERADRVKLYRSNNFELNPDLLSQSSSLFRDKINVSDAEYLDVDQIDIVEFVRSLAAPIRIMKIDIEGAEVPVLEALIQSGMIDKIERLFVETHETKIPQLRERTSKLRSLAKANWPKKVNLDWH